MYKIFKVIKGTVAEKEVSKLIEKGSRYIPQFEENIEIVDFCLDLEIIADGVVEPDIYLIISGFNKNTTYINTDLIEVSEEELKCRVLSGYSIEGVGTNNLLQHLGFNKKPFVEGINQLKI